MSQGLSSENDSQDQMTLIEHLKELRYRLIKSAQGLAVGVAVCLYYAEQIFTVIRAPVVKYLPEGGLVFTHPIDKFMATFKVGVLGGVILTCPFWLYHLWKFISPGLYKNERRYMAGFIFAGSILFCCGVAFVYFFVFPAAFEYLFSIGGNVDKPMITIHEYLSFFIVTTLMFGLSFELPVVLMVLAMMGVVDAAYLKTKRRHALLILAVICAFITPPDGLSMIMMLVPMYVLYELSIWMILLCVKPKKDSDSSNLPAHMS